MARGQTLESILNKVRAKARLSLNAANNTQVIDSHKVLIKTEQDRLWEDYAWPHMRVHKYVALQAGQYLYDLPADTYDSAAGTYTLQMDRVEHISVFDGGEWRPLVTEITELMLSDHQTALDQRSWPVRAWQANADDQIEVWPIPDQNGDATTYEGYLRVTGIRDLRALTAESDRADLDDELLSDYVAGALLAAAGASDAQLRLEAANKRYAKLKGKQTKSSSFNMFSTTSRETVRRRPYIGRYVP
jgi:hypothetical protein